jgi:alanyl-tRNA synthetase
MGLEASEHGKDLPFGQDDARYVEIWNLVFMQFDRSAIADPLGKTTGYKLTPLPKPSIDTGMGLERVAAVLQGKLSNFETDLFTPLINRAAELVNFKYTPINTFSTDASGPPSPGAQQGSMESERLNSASLRIVADHARASTFLINDGVLPANESRGYVLRKILRRGIRHGRLLGQDQPFLHQMVFAVRDLMQGAYPELDDSASRVSKVVEAEEKQFDRVLNEGTKRFDQAIAAMILPYFEDQAPHRGVPHGIDLDEVLETLKSPAPGSAIQRAIRMVKEWDEQHFYSRDSRPPLPFIFPGDKAFHFYETYGLPIDFMVDAARDYEISFDTEGFERARSEEQARARASWKGGSQKTTSPAFRDLPKTAFEGYRSLNSTGSEVLAIVKDGQGVPAAAAGDSVDVVLDRTTFYSDSGGQVGDTGVFTSTDGNVTVAEITGSVLPVQGVRVHKAILKQPLTVGDHVNTVVNGERRDAIRRNHTGTHLLHAALRQVLGTHVKQAGSLVDPTRLRFDFSHFAQVADEELQDIENIVNREVLSNARVETLEDVPIDVAVNEYHAMALFGEKYGDKVRVVKLSDGFSTELCGGTHTAATGEIGLLKLTGESSVSSGVRRVEAISGLGSLSTFRRDAEVAQFASSLAPIQGNDPAAGLRARFESQEDELKRLRRELEEMRMKTAAGGLDDVVARAAEVKGVKLLTHRADNLDRGQLRTLVDNLKQKAGEGVVVLASAQPEGKVAIIAGVTPGLLKRIQAGKLVGAVAKFVGGSGGGKPEIAEAGGKDQSRSTQP